MVRMRLVPDDEFMHTVDEAENFNESMYFNVFDAERRVGGWFRLGNRPNEGHAEMTVCLYLPDGSVGFMYQRPSISGNDAFDAGGMRFRVVEPFERLDVAYDGSVCLLADPTEMRDPGRAFRHNPHEPCHVELAYTGLVTPAGGEPVRDDGSPAAEPTADDESLPFFRGHYEQHVAATGTVRVGEREWSIDGFGHRDHSWGPRYWQSPWWYRWLTMNFGPDLGVMVVVRGHRDGRVTSDGIVFDGDGGYVPVEEATLDTTWSEPELHHRRLRVTARTADREYAIDGDVMSLIPLRNRRTSPDGEELVTRISEGMTEWRLDGRVGFGLSEYLDQIVDGRPVGAGT